MFLSLSLSFFTGSPSFFIHLLEQHNRKKEKQPLISYRPFSSCLEPLSQSEANCERFCTCSLVLKMRVFGTRKRPITIRKQVWNKFSPKIAHVVSSFSCVFLFCLFLPETKIGRSLWPKYM